MEITTVLSINYKPFWGDLKVVSAIWKAFELPPLLAILVVIVQGLIASTRGREEVMPGCLWIDPG